MAQENILKKEFKKSDVQRVRNLVNKDYTSKTKLQTGYQKKQERYKEGDVWEESGKTWTIKNGLKQNITKLDSAKKALRTPLACPKCSGSLKHHLSKKMFKIHGVCFDCVVEMEANLRKAGLFEQYQKRIMQGNMRAFAKDIEQWAIDFVNVKDTFITEAGDVEEWKGDSSNSDKRLLDNVKEYLTHLNTHLD